MMNRFHIEEAGNGWVVTLNDNPSLCRGPENTFVFTDAWELSKFLMKCQRRSAAAARSKLPVRP